MVAHRRKLDVGFTTLVDEKLASELEQVSRLCGLTRGEYVRRVLRKQLARHRTLRPAYLRTAVEKLTAEVSDGDER